MDKMEQSVHPKRVNLVTEFRRNLNHNYLIFKVPVSEDTDGFSFQMIKENNISSLLAMEVKNENGEKELCYEISSLQSLARIYEIRKITGEELAEMICSILEVFQKIKEYMLTEEEIVMLPEYIFMNPETRQMRFMYCPYIKQNCGNLFWELAEFFLDHVEHQDSEAVVLAYQFYKIVRSENYVLQEIQQLCEKRYENTIRKEQELIENIESSEKIQENRSSLCMKERVQTEEIENKTAGSIPKRKQLPIFLFIALLSLFLIIKNSNPINSYSKIISIGFFLFGVGGAVVCFLKYKIAKKDLNLITKESTEKISEKEEQEEKLIQMQDLPYAEPEYGRQPNEVVYGKTEFCLITPEEEERVLIEKSHGKRHKIDKIPYTIGKLKDMSDLYLSDHTVSRLHARIFEEEGKLYILDLGSTNGTYLNGISINQEEKFLLESGDELRIGKTEFVYQ